MEKEMSLFEKIIRIIACIVCYLCFAVALVIISPILIVYSIVNIPFVIADARKKKELKGDK